jgi:Stress responsive A/B Barrel Domain
MMKPFAAVLAAAFLASCAGIAPPAESGSVDHVVIVWLKRPGNAKDQQKLIEIGRDLRVIPGLRFLDSGTALPSERPTVDDSFDIGYVMRFDSPAALEAYAVHPVHVKAKDELVRLSSRILVYDVTRQ